MTVARARRWSCALVLASLLLPLAGCSDAGVATPGPAGSASLGPALSGSPIAAVSPVVGRLVKLSSEGLTRVTGFTVRTDDGTELEFRIGVIENGAEFPPGHLAEHMALGTAIRVFFRDEDGARVVYRLEDAE